MNPGSERRDRLQYTLVLTHPAEEGEGYSIIETDYEARHQADADLRRHVKSHLEVLRRLKPWQIALCLAKKEIVRYGDSPLASIILYTDNCPDECSHLECGEEDV